LGLAHHDLCFGCGTANLFGLQLELEREPDGSVRGRFFVKQDHQGPPGVAHGGVLAAALDEAAAYIFPDDPRLLNPPSMLAAVAAQLAETGQTVPAEPPALARTILDSLALRYASVLRTVEALTGRAIGGVQIVGGGSQNVYLNQATANAAGLPVLAGPVEATVTGNVLVQAIAAGRFASLAEARRHVAANVRLKEFAPAHTPAWAAAARRYAVVEARYAD
jgi:rhamnulokinase